MTDSIREALEVVAKEYLPAEGGYGVICADDFIRKVHELAATPSDSKRDSAGAGDGWRPIETAPKDGSFVYVTDQVHPDVARIASWRVPITHRKGEAWCTKKGCAIGNLPTQWMPLREPLPAAPSQPHGE